MEKTNAMKALDAAGIDYQVIEVDTGDAIDGVSVAQALGRKDVYKTLVLQGDESKFVAVIPVEDEIDFEKAEMLFADTGLKLIPQEDLEEVTGYKRGGCSPIGMKEEIPTVISARALFDNYIIINGGEVGKMLQIAYVDLLKVTGAVLGDISKE